MQTTQSINLKTILKAVQASHNLNENEVEKLQNNPVSKLIAALPYFAGCSNPMELSILKVSMYITATKNPDIFIQKPDQSIRNRIEKGTICPDGNPEVVKLITDFLEMISINDNLEDYYSDLAAQHYNPLFDNMGFYLNRKAELKDKINSYPDQKLVSELLHICNPFKMIWWQPY